MFDLLKRGDFPESVGFLPLRALMGDLLVLIKAELFSVNVFESFWDLTKIKAGVEAFFLEEEKLSEGWFEPSIDWLNMINR